MKHICKQFNKVTVLDQVDFTLHENEIHALTGENGAGKSTLMKILTGLHQANEGSIYVNGSEHRFLHPLDAEKQGIVFIHQELNLLPYLSISANCFLGKEIHNTFGVLHEKEMQRRTEAKLQEIGLSLSGKTLVGSLPIGHQQIVEITKALLVPNIRVIVMDEPTASLSKYETEYLFDIIRDLKTKGVSIVYISHRMEEIFSLCDRITILRDGKHVHTGKIADIDLQKTISLMVGRVLTQQFPKRKYKKARKILSVCNLNKKKTFSDISFDLHEGEILGIAGLVGAGRSDLLHALFGSEAFDFGQIKLEEKDIIFRSPHHAMLYDFAFVTEDRKQEGFVHVFDIKKNLSLPNLKEVSKRFLLSFPKEQQLAENLCKMLNVKYNSTTQTVESLSGGNQQKIVVSKWLCTLPKILLLDEPTRGIDVGSKYEIYQLMHDLSKQGVSIIIVSSELPEILGMSDRILVMRAGRIEGEFLKEEASQENIMQVAAHQEVV